MIDISPELATPPSADRTKAPSSWPAIILAGALGGLMTYVGLEFVLDSRLLRDLSAMEASEAGVLAAVTVVLVWLTLLIHEAGHLLAGWSAGMQPLLLLCGPLRLDFEGGRSRARLNRQVSTWGGLAVAVPHGEADGRSLMLTVVGGPLASAVLATGAYGAAARASGGLGMALLLLAVMSGVIAAGTLLPLNVGVYVSDGAQLWQMLRGSPDTGHRLQLAAVVGGSMAGHRPRLWPSAPLDRVAGAAQAPILRLGALLMRAQQQDDLHPGPITDASHPALVAYESLARDLHAGSLAHCPTAVRSAILLPVATFLAQRLEQGSASRAWLDAASTGTAEDWERLYAQAAVAWAEGRLEDARCLAFEGLRAAKRGTETGAKVMACERLGALTGSPERLMQGDRQINRFDASV